MNLPNAWLWDAAWIAWDDVTASIRSRRTLMVAAVFAGSILLFGWQVIHLLENLVAHLIEADAAEVAGIWNSPEYTRLTRRLLGARLQAGLPVDLPPIAWIYGIAAFLLTPVLVAWTSAPRMAEEIGARTVCYVTVRASRFAWCLGKYLGQAVQLLLAAAITGLGMGLLAAATMTNLPASPAAMAILKVTLLAWIWGLGFLGLAMGFSLLTSRHTTATLATMLALIGIARVHRLAERAARSGGGSAWEVIDKLLPTGYYYDLWTWDSAHLISAVAMLLGLSLFYLLLGYAFFARRDL